MQMKQAVPMPIVNWSADGQQFQQQPERKMHTYILERWTSSINKEVFQQPWKSEWQKGGMDWLQVVNMKTMSNHRLIKIIGNELLCHIPCH